MILLRKQEAVSILFPDSNFRGVFLSGKFLLVTASVTVMAG